MHKVKNTTTYHMIQSNSCHGISSIVSAFVFFFLLYSPVYSLKSIKYIQQENETFMFSNKAKKMKLINAHLTKINKPFVKSIKSLDGDIIDCVLVHLQPTFDLLGLKETILLDQPELPEGHANTGSESEIKQLWNSNGESCPSGTIPIRRTSASELLRSGSISKFGKKFDGRKNMTSRDHEHAIAYVTQGEFYGAKALLSVWKPNVVGYDFSLSQIWVIANVPTRELQTVEAGWQIYPTAQDNAPRLFTYWTPNGYQSGCYNLLCPGFVQTNSKVCLGAAIDPSSTFNGQQYDVAFMIWKDLKTGNWWLRVGSEVMGYWPTTLFTDLRDHAMSVEYGGEVYAENLGKHTSTQMGSGHFSSEGFGKSAYVRNLEVIDMRNKLTAVSNLILLAEKPDCYDIISGYSNSWGNYIYYGGPGNNPNCP